jgi:hypothetical protein
VLFAVCSQIMPSLSPVAPVRDILLVAESFDLTEMLLAFSSPKHLRRAIRVKSSSARILFW